MISNRLIFAVIASIAVGSGIQAVYAQTEFANDGNTDWLMGYAIAGGSFIVAGLAYSCLGYVKKIRRALAGESVHIDYTKMRNAVILGIAVGVGAFIMSAYNGDVIHISTMHEFFTQVAINSAAVLYIDKILLGRPDGQKGVVNNGNS